MTEAEKYFDEYCYSDVREISGREIIELMQGFKDHCIASITDEMIDDAKKFKEWKDTEHIFNPKYFHGKCANCGTDEKYTYLVPQFIWNTVIPKNMQNEIVCAKCFHKFAITYKNS